MISRTWLAGACFAAATIAAATAARADSISFGGIKYDQIRIVKIQDGEIYYKSPQSDDNHKPIRDNTMLSVDDEPAFTSAEELYAANKFPEATDKYMQALDSSNKPWIRDWAAMRLQATAEKSHRFDAAIIGWIAQVMKDPEAADKNAPALPAATSPQLTAGISKVKSAAMTARKDSQKSVLLNYLVKLQTLNNDADGAQDTLSKLQGLQTSDTGADAADRQSALLISKALLMLNKKDYNDAIDLVEKNRQLFTRPAQQSDALWVLAEGRAALAGNSKNLTTLQDLALNYMQVVSHFHDSPRASMALLKTAELLERMNDNQAALRAYGQIVSEYPDQAAASQAKQSEERLKAAGVTLAAPAAH